MNTTLWVPLVGSGTVADPYRPDLPDTVPFTAEVPVELEPGDRHGAPAVSHCRIRVDQAHAGQVTAAVAKAQVNAHDRFLVAACRALNPRDPRALVQVRRELDLLPAATEDDKAAARHVLLHLVRRGYPLAEADAVAAEKKL